MQGLFEVLAIPYSHSGVLSSALAMDKRKSKAVYARAGLDIAQDVAVTREQAAAAHPLKPPYVIKPVNEGSSFGVVIVREGANGPAREIMEPGWVYGDNLMAEEFIPGRELTVGVMGDRALAVTEITTLRDSDFRYEEATDRLVILETNTQPGMTPTSLVPEQAAFAGIAFEDLVSWMIEDASCRR